MTMSLTALDILERAESPPTQARAIARAIEADSMARHEDGLTQPVLKAELAHLRGDLRVEIRDVKSELVRWIFLAVMGQTAASAGLMYFLLELSAR